MFVGGSVLQCCFLNCQACSETILETTLQKHCIPQTSKLPTTTYNLFLHLLKIIHSLHSLGNMSKITQRRNKNKSRCHVIRAVREGLRTTVKRDGLTLTLVPTWHFFVLPLVKLPWDNPQLNLVAMNLVWIMKQISIWREGNSLEKVKHNQFNDHGSCKSSLVMLQ